MVSKFKEYELDGLLNDVFETGFVIITVSKLWRLLEKGSRAAGTWKALLDYWVEARDGNTRDGLHISEFPGEKLLIAKTATTPVKVWAAE